MKVNWLYAYPENPEYWTEYHARVCTNTLDKLGTKPYFVDNLIEARHLSTIEQNVAAFEITCSRAIANELVRHRHFSYCQESSRYVNLSDFSLDSRIDEVNINSIDNVVEEIKSLYNTLIADGMAKEIARDILPLGMSTRLTMTGNARCWFEFMEKRLKGTAHPDMVKLSNKILIHLISWFPKAFKRFEGG